MTRHVYQLFKVIRSKVEVTSSRDVLADKNAVTRQWIVIINFKFINSRFCACAVQMLLKMAVNATICSTFEVQYGKSTSIRTTNKTFWEPLTDHVISRMRRNSFVFLAQGRALFSQITIIIFIVSVVFVAGGVQFTIAS